MLWEGAACWEWEVGFLGHGRRGGRTMVGGREEGVGAVVPGCTEWVGGGGGGLWLCRIEGGAEASLGLKSEFEET